MIGKRFRNLLKRATSNGSTLKDYILGISSTHPFNGWTLSSICIFVEKDEKTSPATFNFVSKAKYYGDWCTLNERYFFNTREEAIGELTGQVYAVSPILVNVKIFLVCDTNYALWCLSSLEWKRITREEYLEQAY